MVGRHSHFESHYVTFVTLRSTVLLSIWAQSRSVKSWCRNADVGATNFLKAPSDFPEFASAMSNDADKRMCLATGDAWAPRWRLSTQPPGRLNEIRNNGISTRACATLRLRCGTYFTKGCPQASYVGHRTSTRLFFNCFEEKKHIFQYRWFEHKGNNCCCSAVSMNKAVNWFNEGVMLFLFRLNETSKAQCLTKGSFYILRTKLHVVCKTRGCLTFLKS